jgi:hypothetical protein
MFRYGVCTVCCAGLDLHSTHTHGLIFMVRNFQEDIYTIEDKDDAISTIDYDAITLLWRVGIPLPVDSASYPRSMETPKH